MLASLPDKTVILGVLDLSDPEVESAEVVAGRIRRALPHVSADRLVIAPDCGLKYLPRASAFGKMQALVQGAAIGAGRARQLEHAPEASGWMLMIGAVRSTS